MAEQQVTSPIRWSWSLAGLGLACAAPSALVTTKDPQQGLALAVGVLCAAGLGLRPTRRERFLAVIAGVLAGTGVAIGSIVAPYPVVAVGAVFLAGLGTAALVPRWRLGSLTMALALPLMCAGLSEPGLSVGAPLGLLIVAGSVYAWLVSLLWPERRAWPAARPPLMDSRQAQRYGLRLGLTGALAAASGFALGLDHPGWPCIAAIIVSRPAADLTRDRAVGRAVAVVVGALLALGLAAAHPPSAVLAAGVALAVTGMAATAGSRWYITAGFTTFVVISLLLLDDPDRAAWWFVERVGATLIGVTIACAVMVGPGLVGARSNRERS